MGKARRLREQRAAQERADRELMRTDPRLTIAHARHVPGARLSRLPYVITVVSPMKLPDGRRVWFQAPQAVAFNLLEAKRFRDSGEASRVAALDDLKPRPDGSWQPADASLVLNALSDLSAAVLFSFAAIEALVNHTIDQLPEGTTYVDSRKRTRSKAEMVRWLSIEEKLRGAVLLFTKAEPLDKGREPWQSFVRLKDIRDDLVHAKRGEHLDNPDDPAVYGRLLAGEGSSSVEDALALAEAFRPDFLPPNVMEALSSEPVADT